MEIASYPTTLTVVASPDLSIDLTAPATLPYTVVVTDFPAVGGVPTGSGVEVTATCNAEGVSTLTYENGVPARQLPPAPTSVPTLSVAALVALSLVVAVLFARMDIRQRPPAGASRNLRQEIFQ